MPGEHNPGSPNPEGIEPNLADLKAAAAEFADAVAKGRRPENQLDRDEAITNEMEERLRSDEKLAEGPEVAGEAQARRHLEEVHADMEAQRIALEAQIATEPSPESILASSVLSTLKHNIAVEGPGQKRLMEAAGDDDLHRQAMNEVFDGLGLKSPIPELTADNRSRLRKFFRPKNRKTVTVQKPFKTGELEGVISATRSYNPTTKAYELRLHGGQGQKPPR